MICFSVQLKGMLARQVKKRTPSEDGVQPCSNPLKEHKPAASTVANNTYPRQVQWLPNRSKIDGKFALLIHVHVFKYNYEYTIISIHINNINIPY